MQYNCIHSIWYNFQISSLNWTERGKSIPYILFPVELKYYAPLTKKVEREAFQTIINWPLDIDGLQSIPGDSKYKDIAAMLVPSTIEANKHSFVKVPPTWPPWRHMQTKNRWNQANPSLSSLEGLLRRTTHWNTMKLHRKEVQYLLSKTSYFKVIIPSFCSPAWVKLPPGLSFANVSRHFKNT